MAAVDPRTPTMTTALEVVKGALAAVIGFPIGKSTIGSRISEGNKARITVVSWSRVEALLGRSTRAIRFLGIAVQVYARRQKVEV